MELLNIPFSALHCSLSDRNDIQPVKNLCDVRHFNVFLLETYSRKVGRLNKIEYVCVCVCVCDTVYTVVWSFCLPCHKQHLSKGKDDYFEDKSKYY